MGDVAGGVEEAELGEEELIHGLDFFVFGLGEVDFGGDEVEAFGDTGIQAVFVEIAVVLHVGDGGIHEVEKFPLESDLGGTGGDFVVDGGFEAVEIDAGLFDFALADFNDAAAPIEIPDGEGGDGANQPGFDGVVRGVALVAEGTGGAEGGVAVFAGGVTAEEGGLFGLFLTEVVEALGEGAFGEGLGVVLGEVEGFEVALDIEGEGGVEVEEASEFALGEVEVFADFGHFVVGVGVDEFFAADIEGGGVSGGGEVADFGEFVGVEAGFFGEGVELDALDDDGVEEGGGVVHGLLANEGEFGFADGEVLFGGAVFVEVGEVDKGDGDADLGVEEVEGAGGVGEVEVEGDGIGDGGLALGGEVEAADKVAGEAGVFDVEGDGVVDGDLAIFGESEGGDASFLADLGGDGGDFGEEVGAADGDHAEGFTVALGGEDDVEVLFGGEAKGVGEGKEEGGRGFGEGGGGGEEEGEPGTAQVV